MGGGSGGHIYPLLAIAEYYSTEKNWDVSDMHFVVADNNADSKYFENTPYSYSVFPVAKFRRYADWKNFRDMFRVMYNIFLATRFLWKNKPKKIFSKGGFVSLPFGIASILFGIPFYLHETDSQMGLSNKILSRIAKKVFTGFPSSHPHHIFVGNPVRKELFRSDSLLDSPSQSLFSSFSLKNTKSNKNITKIFIFGGSQGAQAINTWARIFFADQNNVSVVLVSGKGKKSNKSIPGIQEYEFLTNEFVETLHDADIVIARAGGSIAELSAAKKCTILIPLPSSANNHQCKNAEYFANKNAVLWIKQNELFSQKTAEQIHELINSVSQQQTLATNLGLLATPNSVEDIIEQIEGNPS